MFLGTEQKETTHKRKSKHGKEHVYKRTKTVVKLQCDNCDNVFTRDLKSPAE